MKYVIIGNSAAGIGAVEGIRQIDANGEITIISSEPHHTYARPLISYYLRGSATLQSMRYRRNSFYEENRIHFLSGNTVVEIRPTEKAVVLDSGSMIPYDKLLVATGSSPFLPSLNGLETVHGVHTFMGLDDAEAIRRAVKPSARVLIIGAGLIGLKCAEGMHGQVEHITVVDLAPRILSSILDEDSARIVQHHLEEKGIEFKLSHSVKSFDQNTAILEDGESIAFELLILAVGVRPNTTLLEEIADVNKGILIDGRGQTSIKDIYAAGDCVQAIDASSGQSKVMALLPNAYMQGECAGINMAGGKKSFDSAIPMNAISFFGLHVITAGNYTGSDFVRVDRDKYKRLFHGENRLNGYILVGDVEKAGIYTSLIRERTPLDSIDFALILEKPGLMAFSKRERTARLGGL